VDYYGRLMMVMGGLRHVRDTGEMPANRAEIDEACREVLKVAPTAEVAREWQELSGSRKSAQRRTSKSKR
jgi:hypothetical protein